MNNASLPITVRPHRLIAWTRIITYLLVSIGVFVGIALLRWENNHWALALIALPLVIGIYQFALIRNTSYMIDQSWIRSTKGLLVEKTDTLELWRYVDIQTKRTLWQRLFHLYTVKVISSDTTHPELELKNIPYSTIDQLIPQLAKQAQQAQHVRRFVD